MIQNIVRFSVGLIAAFLVFGLLGAPAGASPAGKGKKNYPYWPCGKTLTYKTNAKTSFVKRQVKKTAKYLPNYKFKFKKKGKVDINIKFKETGLIAAKYDGSLGYMEYVYNDRDYTFVKTKVITPKWGSRNYKKTIFLHEFWHAVGVPHVGAYKRLSLMNGFLDPWDIEEGTLPNEKDYGLLEKVNNRCNFEIPNDEEPYPDDTELIQP